MTKKILKVMFMLTLLIALVAGCGNQDSKKASSDETNMKTLVCLADTTPHAEILEYAEKDLEKLGIKLNIVSKVWDSTWNEQVENGTVDFHYDAYVPYLDEWNKSNNGHLVGAGGIHLEPLVMCSEKYDSIEDLPQNAVIAIKEDVTNQYRCLKLLEQAGLIELSDEITMSNADVSMIAKYNKPLEIVAMNADVILNTRVDFDAYITNTNRLLEASLDPADYLAREESQDSIFANVICVKEGNENSEAIKKLVSVLQSDDVRNFIHDKYNGAVIPAF
ncbi:MetQ/NlpA family ABC transporter substrate-binding protein [Marinisporobacter balticus]|uniref:D-methionine transport system substrate-binding protein n=1 Tax=Marinisporobacter balticus TaxID=2018667 RepID=A0A4R2KJ74_9FIRM|nr:MetQ/NlpA family ABC transporter substrate-binding protein [Marinisporobacter balticus]TCO70649.1 D-methionine transport system substrate-binding protein [Marinisporobacter balticus]